MTPPNTTTDKATARLDKSTAVAKYQQCNTSVKNAAGLARSKRIESVAGLVIEMQSVIGGKTTPRNTQSSEHEKIKSSALPDATNTTPDGDAPEASIANLKCGNEGLRGLCLVMLHEINSLNFTSEIHVAPIARNMFPQDSARLTLEVLTMLFQGQKAGSTQSPISLSRAALATLRNQTLEANAALIVASVNQHTALMACAKALEYLIDEAREDSQNPSLLEAFQEARAALSQAKAAVKEEA